jgi:thioredoxin-related protein
MQTRRFLSFLIALSFGAALSSASEWQTDYDQALANAKSAKKSVLLAFTGSDWCGPCIMLNKAVFSQEAFLNYARKNLILVEIDFPRRKQLPENVARQNERLSEKYDIERSGFPTVILLNPDGKILGQLEGYSGERSADVLAWIEKLRSKSP